MKINFTLWSTGLYGGVRAVFSVANRLSERGHKVTITTLSGSHKWFPLKVRVNYVEPSNNILKSIELCSRLLLRRPLHFGQIAGFIERRLKVYIDLLKHLSESIPDCDVNVATWYPTAFAVWFSGKGESYYFLQDFWEQMENPYEARAFEATLRLPFYFLTNSCYTKNIILNIQSYARVKVVSVGVDINIFYPRSERVLHSNNRRLVMIIIRGPWYKGADTAIKVLNEINKIEPIHALIAGPAICLNQLRKTLGMNFPYTHFENVDDNELAKLYSSADVFLFTSRVESFGLPPLEAMGCGTPVVTTDCKGNRDYAIDGYNSLISPPDNIERLKELMLKVLRDKELREKLVKGGLDTAVKWDWNRVTDRFESAFNEKVKLYT